MAKKYNLVVLDGYTMNPGDLSWKSIQDLGDCRIYERTPYDQIVQRSSNADIVLTNKVVFDRSVLSNLPQLKYIAVTATGYNIIDMQAAKEKNILVSNVPAYGTDSVAQMVFAYILNLSQNAAHYNQSVHNGRWLTSKDFCYWDIPLVELKDKTLGIIGFGLIGRKVAQIGKAFGMQVIVSTRTINEGNPDVEFVEQKELFRQSDYITLHCPLTERTEHIINKKNISQMKKNVVIINTGRGGLINENDLAVALNASRIQAACVDVLSSEPPHKNNPLLTAKNCFITPHIAWATISARQRLMDTVAENIRSFINGIPNNIINR